MDRLYRVKVKSDKNFVIRPYHSILDEVYTQDKIKYPGYRFVIGSKGIMTEESINKLEPEACNDLYGKLANKEGDVIQIFKLPDGQLVLKIDFGFIDGIVYFDIDSVDFISKY